MSDPVHVVCHMKDADAYLPKVLEQYPEATVSVLWTETKEYPGIAESVTTFPRRYMETPYEESRLVYIYSRSTQRYQHRFSEFVNYHMGLSFDVTYYMGDTVFDPSNRGESSGRPWPAISLRNFRPKIVSERNRKYMSDYPQSGASVD